MSNFYEERIKAIFGEGVVQDYEEHGFLSCVSFVLKLPVQKKLLLPQQLDEMCELLGKKDYSVTFTASGGVHDHIDADLYVHLYDDSEHGNGELLMPRKFKSMRRYNLRVVMDEVTTKLGHRKVRAEFRQHAKAIYMMIHAHTADPL